MKHKLPAVVLDIDTPIGLTVIRALGSQGVPVIGIGYSATALGMSSRYLTRGLVRAATPAGLIRQLLKLSSELGEACLFASSETDIVFLNRYRDRLGGFKLMFADERRMTSVLDKARTYAAAARVGVPTPRTVQIERLEEAEALSTTLRYPVVLKWSNPLTAGHLLKPLGLAPDKARYCHSPRELLDYLRQFKSARAYPLIQEYCAGYGLGQFILMKEGRAHFTFQHRRVHEWPPEGGFSSVCESMRPDLHQDLMDKSIALLRELEWEGVAMVEYCHDPATGQFALMEINGRFWGSLPLAYHAGANFPMLSYRLFGLGEAIVPAPYRVGLRCRYMVPETKRLLRVLFAQRKISVRKTKFSRLPELLGYLADFVRPRSRYFVFDTRDPKPFFSDLKHMSARALGLLSRSVPPEPDSLHKNIANGG